jgi:hypothetical protein
VLRFQYVVVALCAVVIFAGGFATGYAARSQEDGVRDADRRQAFVCSLDILIDESGPDDRLATWGAARLIDECGLTETEARDVRDEP